MLMYLQLGIFVWGGTLLSEEFGNTKLLILLLEVCICRIFIFLERVTGQEKSMAGAMLNRSNEIRSW